MIKFQLLRVSASLNIGGQLPVESGCGAVEVGLVCLLPPLSFGGALVPLP